MNYENCMITYIDKDVIKNIIEDINNKDITDPYIRDNIKWTLTKNQLKAIKVNLSDEEFKKYLNDNLNPFDLYNNEVLFNIVQDKIIEYDENHNDIDNKFANISIYLDDQLERHIDINFTDIKENYNTLNTLNLNNLNNLLDNHMQGNEENLPIYNNNIENQISEICKMALFDLPEERVNEIIEYMKEEYKEEPYTIDYLEGYLTGFLDGIDEE